MILNALEPVWPLAKDLKRFLLTGKFDGQAIEGLVEILSNAVQSHLSNKAQEKLVHSLDAMKKIQELEANDTLSDENEMENLEAMLQHL